MNNLESKEKEKNEMKANEEIDYGHPDDDSEKIRFSCRVIHSWEIYRMHRIHIHRIHIIILLQHITFSVIWFFFWQSYVKLFNTWCVCVCVWCVCARKTIFISKGKKI